MVSPASVLKAKEALMQALSNLYADNLTNPLLKDVAQDAGYKGTSGKAIRTAIKQLKDLGMIKTDKDQVEMTLEGINKMPKPGPRAPRATNADIQALQVHKILKDPKGIPKEDQIKKIFHCMSDGAFHKRENLAKTSGYSGSDSKPFRNLITRMDGMKLIEKGSGTVKLSDVCFPRGRPTAGSPTQVEAETRDKNEVPSKDQGGKDRENEEASTGKSKHKRKMDGSKNGEDEEEVSVAKKKTTKKGSKKKPQKPDSGEEEAEVPKPKKKTEKEPKKKSSKKNSKPGEAELQDSIEEPKTKKMKTEKGSKSKKTIQKVNVSKSQGKKATKSKSKKPSMESKEDAEQ